MSDLPERVKEKLALCRFSSINGNLVSVVHGIEAVLPGMQERKRGAIINISSVVDRHVRPHLTTYAASKAAVRSLTESLRQANAKIRHTLL